jgi:hypothetical protein
MAAGAVAGSTAHADPDGFLGLNWTSIGVTVFVTMLTAVAADIALTEWHAYRKRNR